MSSLVPWSSEWNASLDFYLKCIYSGSNDSAADKRRNSDYQLRGVPVRAKRSPRSRVSPRTLLHESQTWGGRAGRPGDLSAIAEALFRRVDVRLRGQDLAPDGVEEGEDQVLARLAQ